MEIFQGNTTENFSKKVTRDQYKNIRNKRSFLFEYFKIETKSPMPQPQFAAMFGMWLSNAFHMPEQAAVVQIAKYLDNKYK